MLWRDLESGPGRAGRGPDRRPLMFSGATSAAASLGRSGRLGRDPEPTSIPAAVTTETVGSPQGEQGAGDLDAVVARGQKS